MSDFDAHHPLWLFEGPRRTESIQALKDYYNPSTGATGAGGGDRRAHPPHLPRGTDGRGNRGPVGHPAVAK